MKGAVHQVEAPALAGGAVDVVVGGAQRVLFQPVGAGDGGHLDHVREAAGHAFDGAAVGLGPRAQPALEELAQQQAGGDHEREEQQADGGLHEDDDGGGHEHADAVQHGVHEMVGELLELLDVAGELVLQLAGADFSWYSSDSCCSWRHRARRSSRPVSRLMRLM